MPRFAFLACATLAGPVWAQSPDPGVSRTPRALEARARTGVIRAHVNRVFIPATVTDSLGRPVEGLQKQDFRLLENGVERELSEFFVEDGPVSIGVVLDISGSVRNKLAQARRAISEFLRLSIRDDEYFLITFRDQPELVCGFTNNLEDIEADLALVQPSGWTALYDAMFMAINHMKRASRNRRVLLVMSDGSDNNSRFTPAEATNLVREADVRILSVSVQSRTPALDKLAEESGGRAYRVRRLEDLPELAVALSAEVHAEYVLGFVPPKREGDGKFHTIKVEVVQAAGDSPFRVSWRRGYYAPLD